MPLTLDWQYDESSSHIDRFSQCAVVWFAPPSVPIGGVDGATTRPGSVRRGARGHTRAYYLLIRVLYPYRTVFGESVHGVINMKDEDGFEPTSESTHLSLPTRYELANGFTSTPSRLLGDLQSVAHR